MTSNRLISDIIIMDQQSIGTIVIPDEIQIYLRLKMKFWCHVILRGDFREPCIMSFSIFIYYIISL